MENPYIRAEDVSAVVDYIITQPYFNAAINDHRIKAVDTVSAANIGGTFRNGWDGKIKDADALSTLELGGKIHSGDAEFESTAKGDIGTIPFIPTKEEEAKGDKEMEEAWEYYRLSVPNITRLQRI